MSKYKICNICKIEFFSENGKTKVCLSCRWVPKIKNCINCGNEFLTKGPSSNHCSRKCISTTRNKMWAVGGEAWRKKWGAEADIKMEEFRKKLSDATKGEKNPMYGKLRPQSVKDALSKFHSRTIAEKYGEEKAAEISAKISDAMKGEKNPAYGKVYSRGGRSIKGYYKGKFFRSLLEYSFMKHIESLGTSLDNLDYENFVIPWIDEQGTNRTYRPDFFDLTSKVVYEVKQSYAVSFCKLKHEAACLHLEKRGITFKVVTEKDFPKIAFENAIKDSEVKWDERTFKYFENL